MNPTRKKNLLSSFSVGAQDDGTRIATTRAPSQLLSTRGMGQRNNQKGAIGAKERQQRKTIKMIFSFPPEERARFSFSQPRKDDGTRCCDKGAFSAPQRAWDGTTQQSKRSNRRQ